MDTQEILFTALAAFSFIFILFAKPKKKKYIEEPDDDIFA